MKKILLLMILLCFALGCTDTFDEDLTGFKNCGESEECVNASLRNCEKAYGFEIHEDVLTKEKWIFVGYGEEDGKCRFAIKLYSVEGKNEEGELKSMLAPFFLKFNEMECTFPIEVARNFEEFEGEEAIQYCEGPMFSLMKHFKEHPEDMEKFNDNPFATMPTRN